jgi:hypothetical protein
MNKNCSNVIADVGPQLAVALDQTERFRAAVNLRGYGFALVFGHVRVDTLPGARMRVFPNTAPENRAVHIALVDIGLDSAVWARKAVHDLDCRHFLKDFSFPNQFLFFFGFYMAN